MTSVTARHRAAWETLCLHQHNTSYSVFDRLKAGHVQGRVVLDLAH
jgi:hypothetical protein